MEKEDVKQPVLEECKDDQNASEDNAEKTEDLLNQPVAEPDVDFGGYDDDADFLQSSENDAQTVKKAKIKKIGHMTTKAVAYTAVMTALVFVGTIIGYSNEAFYFNLGDAVILICAALFNPVSAMLAGGLGAFFGDLVSYPSTMLFTLVIKAIEGLVAGFLFSLINKWYDKKLEGVDDGHKDVKKKAYALKIVFSCLASLISVVIMMMGYFMCQSLFYGTVAGAIVALPFDFAQGAISLTIANLALYALRLDGFRHALRINIKARTKNDLPIEND